MKTTNRDGQELWVVLDKNFEPLRYKAPFNRFGNGIIYYTRGQALKKQGFGLGKAIPVKKLLSWVKEVEGHLKTERTLSLLVAFDKKTADGTGMAK
jgi:hypothetical protein